MAKDLDDDTKEIIASFIAEGYERLDDAEVQLGKLDGERDGERLNSVFRLFHSVKGSAAFLGFDRIKSLTHQAETLLEIFIKEKAPVTQESLDVVFATIDVLRSLIKAVERDYDDESGAELAEEQTAAIIALIARLRAESTPAEPPLPPSAAEAATGSRSKTGPPPEPAPNEDENAIRLNELVSRDMVERFCGESLDLIDRMEKTALGLPAAADKAESVNELFRSAHTIKGNSGFFGYSALEAMCQEAEAYLDAVRRGRFAPDESFVNGLMPRLDRMRKTASTVKVLAPGNALSGEYGSAEPPENVARYRPIGEILVEMGAAKAEDVQQALESQERPLGQILVDQGLVAPEDVSEALKIQVDRNERKGTEPSAPGGGEEIQRKEIRVDTAKLDKLFDLIGELITAEAMVLNSPELEGLQLDGFSKAFTHLNKISREIQETTMMIRMIPMEGLFQKMTRLVRDLSRKFDKPVEFRFSGSETEMDKNVIEQISDPLVHIIRNAIDHGIEKGPDRIAAGKAAQGSISLDARYEGSEIWVTVRDDGAGLNRAKILKKAAEKGMLQGPPEEIPDEAAWNFIFEPGFSTADVVSDVSGRGVGMDVVKKNIERIRGSVDIKTAPGVGTEFVLKIPLTMAIVDGITVRSGGNFYSLPTTDILEFFKATPSQLTETDKGQYMVNLRGSIIPLVKLGEVFAIPGAVDDPCAGIVIVVKDRSRTACLLIDEVIGNQQIVVKSLSAYLGKVEGISGCSILGDGRVSFIIDTGRLLSLRLA